MAPVELLGTAQTYGHFQAHALGASHGLSKETPNGSESDVLHVTTVSPCGVSPFLAFIARGRRRRPRRKSGVHCHCRERAAPGANVSALSCAPPAKLGRCRRLP